MDLAIAVCIGVALVYLGLRAPEVALSLGFAVFMFSGQIRERIDVSTTALCAVFPIVAIVGGMASRYRVQISRADLLFTLFAGIVLQSLRYSGSQEYGHIKAMQFLALAYLTVVAIVYVINTYDRLRVTLDILHWSLLTYLLVSAVQYATGSAHIVDDRLAGLSDPIVSGRMYILGVLFIAYWWYRPGQFRTAICWVLSAVALVLAFSSGTRTAVVSLVATAVLVAAIHARRLHDLLGRRRLSMMAVAVFAMVAFTLLTPDAISRFLPDSVQKRFGSVYALAGMDQIEEKGARLDYYETAYGIICDSPVYGVGLGGFKDRSSRVMDVNDDPRAPVYPHNIIAEVTSEQGVIGLAVFLAIIVFACRRIMWLRTRLPYADPMRQRVIATVMAIFLFGLLTAQTSLDMPRQVILWWGLGLLLSLDRIMRRDSVAYYDKSKCGHAGVQPCRHDPASHAQRTRPD